MRAAADAVRAWVAERVAYSFKDRGDKATDTLSKRRGMCTNKATLQVALMRALGIPAGYCIVHIHKGVPPFPHSRNWLLPLHVTPLSPARALGRRRVQEHDTPRDVRAHIECHRARLLLCLHPRREPVSALRRDGAGAGGTVPHRVGSLADSLA